MANNILPIATKILEKIEEYDRIILFRHFRPDGDAVGSTKGLQAILKATYPEKEILLQNSDFANYVAFLGKEDKPISDELYRDALGIVIGKNGRKSLSKSCFLHIKNPPVRDIISLAKS